MKKIISTVLAMLITLQTIVFANPANFNSPYGRISKDHTTRNSFAVQKTLSHIPTANNLLQQNSPPPVSSNNPTIAATTPINNPYRYAGYEYLETVELYDLNARYYNPQTARFLSQDPYYNLGNRIVGLYEVNVPTAASIMQANNLYTYCGNNPITLFDPSGLIPTPEEAAYMAQHIYTANKEDEDKDLGKNFGGWTLDYRMTTSGGLVIGVYERTVDGVTEYSLVNKGTSTSGDWIDNIGQPIGFSEDMKDSIAKADGFYKKHKDSEITMIGHSKGGAEAVANAVATNVNCIVFNPATTNLEAYGLSSDNYTANMTVYAVEGEILTTALSLISAPIDKFISLKPKNKYLPVKKITDIKNVWQNIKSSYKNHSIEAVIWGLKNTDLKN